MRPRFARAPMPASCSASWNASDTRCSVPQSQRSPNFEQPMPMIATLSLIPVAIGHSLLPISQAEPPSRNIDCNVAAYPSLLPDIPCAMAYQRRNWRHRHRPFPSARALRCRIAPVRRTGAGRIEHQPICSKGCHLGGSVRQRGRLHRLSRAAIHAGRKARKLDGATPGALTADKPDHLITARYSCVSAVFESVSERMPHSRSSCPRRTATWS